jgi:DNA mismatch repair protein MSH4
VRGEIPSLFRVCESIAMLDMIAAFAQLVSSRSYGDYTRPELTEWLCIKSGRHPIREKVRSTCFPPRPMLILSKGPQREIRPE